LFPPHCLFSAKAYFFSMPWGEDFFLFFLHVFRRFFFCRFLHERFLNAPSSFPPNFCFCWALEFSCASVLDVSAKQGPPETCQPPKFRKTLAPPAPPTAAFQKTIFICSPRLFSFFCCSHPDCFTRPMVKTALINLSTPFHTMPNSFFSFTVHEEELFPSL